MSRRGIALLLALTLSAGLLTGCGGDSAGEADSTQGFGTEIEAAASGAQELGSQAESSTTGSFSMPYSESYGWEVYSCRSMENRAVMQLIYESLFVMDNQFEPEPLLCQEYTVSDDGLTYTLMLREVKFSSGKTLTADDVLYSMGQAAQSDLYAGRFSEISAYYMSDTKTVIVELEQPNERLPCLLDFPIIPAAGGTNAPAGTGPFVRTDSVLTVNTQWWQGPENLNFQSVTLYASGSAEDTRDNFEIDNVHFVYNDPTASTAATFHCDYELWNSRSTVMQYIGFNFNSEMFDDPDTRAALSHAIDRTSIAESVYHNFADAASLPVPPASSLYNEELAQKYAFTSADAAMEELAKTDSFQLPKEALASGVSPSPEAEAVVSSSPEVADQEDKDTEEADPEASPTTSEKADELAYNSITLLVQSGNLYRETAAKETAEDLTEAGFTVTLKSYDQEEFEAALLSSEWDIYYGEVMLRPDFDLSALLELDGSLNYGSFTGPTELFSLMDSAKENGGNSYDLYEYIMERGYLCPVLFINNAVFTTRGVFTGLNPSPDALFYQISKIHVHQN